VTGQLASSQTVQAIVHGVAASSINRSAKVTGQLASSQTVQSTIRGAADAGINRSATIQGSSSEQAERGAKVTGQSVPQETITANRSAKVTGQFVVSKPEKTVLQTYGAKTTLGTEAEKHHLTTQNNQAAMLQSKTAERVQMDSNDRLTINL